MSFVPTLKDQQDRLDRIESKLDAMAWNVSMAATASYVQRQPSPGLRRLLLAAMLTIVTSIGIIGALKMNMAGDRLDRNTAAARENVANTANDLRKIIPNDPQALQSIDRATTEANKRLDKAQHIADRNQLYSSSALALSSAFLGALFGWGLQRLDVAVDAEVTAQRMQMATTYRESTVDLR